MSILKAAGLNKRYKSRQVVGHVDVRSGPCNLGDRARHFQPPGQGHAVQRRQLDRPIEGPTRDQIHMIRRLHDHPQSDGEQSGKNDPHGRPAIHIPKLVSFSTLQYRQDPDYWRRWFPAHWISESFPGQFRNWFYSLLAMSTVLENKPPFLENFGYASLLAEDGRQMHKSWGNSIEFNDAADKMGVDTMRWLYCAHKPENDLLFGYHRAEDTRRRFIIPLWNVYSFFATYASLDNWTPPTTGFDPGTPEGATPASDTPLDQWILARLNQVIGQVTQNFEDSDAYSATLVYQKTYTSPPYPSGFHTVVVKKAETSGSFTDVDAIEIVNPDLIAPGAVTSLAAVPGSANGSIDLNWSAPANDAGIPGSVPVGEPDEYA